MASVYVHIFPNEKMYIGITSHNNPNKRWRNGSGYKTQKFLWKAIQKYGWDNIQHLVLLSDIQLDVAEEVEKCLISKYSTNCADFGYNVCDGGGTNAGYHHTEEYKENLRMSMLGKYSGENNPNYGKHLSEAQRKKISDSLKGKKPSDSSREKRSRTLSGHVVTEETRRKISEQNRGKVRTAEQRQKMSESRKGVGVGREGYWKGKTQSEETRRKRSESLKGKKKSQETIDKLRISCSGKKHGKMTEEHKLKISLALKGKPKHRRVSTNV